MIQYSLSCENDHKFEAWFKSASAYDDQADRGVVTCPICASASVTKALMAPAVARKQSQKVALSAGHPEQVELHKKLRALREKIVSETDYVGDKFATEARKIHDHEAEARAIYGEATGEEVAGLVEDGIDFMPLPSLPEEHN